MNHPSPDTYLLASRELLLSLGQNTPGLTAEEQANIQEAVEHIDRTRKLIDDHHE